MSVSPPSPSSSAFPLLPACPHLPPAPAAMDWRAVNGHGRGRDAAFYLTVLTYGQNLWQRCLPARAILCIDRALGAELAGDEPELAAWPLPYAALAWVLREAPRDVFIGNPRVHFQHYADRMNEPRRAQRQARAWACWAITRAVAPRWPADPRHDVIEPSHEEIAASLDIHGLPGETALWAEVLQTSAQPWQGGRDSNPGPTV